MEGDSLLLLLSPSLCTSGEVGCCCNSQFPPELLGVCPSPTLAMAVLGANLKTMASAGKIVLTPSSDQEDAKSLTQMHYR